MTQVFYLNTACFFGEELYREAYASLSAARQKKADAYRFERDRFLCVGAGVLLDYVLKKYGLCERDAVMTYGAHGKPQIEGAGICFNLSHSGEIAVCALSSQEVGIDAERVEKRAEAVISRVTTPEEYAYLASLSEGERDRAFIRLWTVKESYVKQTGLGLSLPVKELSVRFNGGVSLTRKGEKVPVYFCEYPLENYCITVCAEQDTFDEIKEIKL